MFRKRRRQLSDYGYYELLRMKYSLAQSIQQLRGMGGTKNAEMLKETIRHLHKVNEEFMELCYKRNIPVPQPQFDHEAITTDDGS